MDINVMDKIDIPASREKIMSYLFDIRHIADYEPKVLSIRVFPKSSTQGTYSARGRFAGIPWRGKFSYRLTKTGFYSEMLSSSRAVQVKGGFKVKGRDKSWQVVHFENYQVPLWLGPMVFPMKIYLKLALRRELLNIRKAILQAK